MHTDRELKQWERQVQSDYRAGRLSPRLIVLAERAGLVWRDARLEITKEQRIAELKRVAKQLGHTPTKDEFIKHGRVSVSTVTTLLGSWNKGLVAAGLDPLHVKGITKAQVIAEIKRVAKSLGRTPKAGEFKKNASMSVTSISNIFGSWNKGLVAAGFDPLLIMGITKTQVIAELKRVAKHLGLAPNTKAFIKYGNISLTILYKLFGSWNKALRAAGLTKRTKQN